MESASKAPSLEIVGLTQADLDRGLTPEEIERDRHDLNIQTFCRELAFAVTHQSVQSEDDAA